MINFTDSKKKYILVSGFSSLLILIAYAIINFKISSNAIFVLMIPIFFSILIFRSRIYLIFAALMLLSFWMLARHENVNNVFTYLILISAIILLTGEFIKWISDKYYISQLELVKSNEKYRALYTTIETFANNSPDLFWSKDIEGRYTFVNKTMCEKIFSVEDSNDVIGNTDMFFAEKETKKHPDNDKWHTLGEICRDSDLITINENKFKRFDEYGYVKGQLIYLDVYKIPLKNAVGEIIGTIGTATDVTKQKEEENLRLIAENELKLSEQKFRKLVENLSEIVYTTDENGKITYINNAFEKLTGYKREKLNEPHPEQLIHPDDFEMYMANIEKVKNNIKVENFEYRSRTALGNYLHFLTTIQPQISGNGKFAGLTGIATEITKIKEAEEEILNNKNKMDTILSAIPDLILILDSNGVYLDIFPRESKYLFAPHAKLQGQSIYSVVPEPVAKEFMTIINKAISTGQLINYKYRLAIDGEGYLFNARVKKIEYEGKTAVLWDASNITAEERIINSLRENEQKFLNLLNYTYDWEYWVELNGNMGYTSPSCRAQTGYEPDEFLKNPSLLQKIVHPDDKAKFIKHLEMESNSTSYGKIEFKILKKNGEMRVIRHTCQAVFENGRLIGRRVTNRNATDRWKAEQKQLQSEKEYKSIFNSLIDVYYRVDLNGIVENVSPSVENISQYKREEIIGKNAGKFYLVPDIRNKLFERTLKDGTLRNYEIEVKDKNGKIKTVSINNKIIRDEKGTPIAIEGMLRDVTELKKTREKLLNANNEIQKYLSIVRVMILVVDRNGIVKLINRRGCKILGYDENEIIGKNWVENFVPAEQKLIVQNVFNSIMNRNNPDAKVNENEIINKSGQLKTIRWRNAYLENSRGDIAGVLSSGEDITEEAKMLHDLIESEKSLKALNAAKDKFFSIVSHDIRSPFTALLGFTQILDEEYESLTDDEIAEVIHSLRKTSNKIFEFIERLLDWSRIQSDKVSVAPQKIELYPIIQDVFVLLSPVALNKMVKIIIDIPKDLKVIGDENVINTVLRNLLSNAIKFTRQDGAVTIFIEDNSNEIIVGVRDTGVGMDEETLSKLFLLDEHISEPGTEKEVGTGLGLLICKDLLEKQQSRIWVESEKNKGSIFRFTLKKIDNRD